MRNKNTDKPSLLIKIIKDKCDLCGCCVGICPEDALELSETRLAIIEGRCTSCAKCVWACPVEAVEFTGTAA